MRNALILHGSANTSQGNWFPWLRSQLEQQSWTVWSPDLPDSDKPNIHKYLSVLLHNPDWKYNEESILVGHSSGAVAILGLLQELPEGVMVDTCYLVGAFKTDLGNPDYAGIFPDRFDFAKIKTKAKHIVFIHSDNDPYCPLDHAEYLSEKTGGELIVKPGQAHFSLSTFGPEYRQFPFLRDLILERAK